MTLRQLVLLILIQGWCISRSPSLDVCGLEHSLTSKLNFGLGLNITVTRVASRDQSCGTGI